MEWIVGLFALLSDGLRNEYPVLYWVLVGSIAALAASAIAFSLYVVGQNVVPVAL